MLKRIYSKFFFIFMLCIFFLTGSPKVKAGISDNNKSTSDVLGGFTFEIIPADEEKDQNNKNADTNGHIKGIKIESGKTVEVKDKNGKKRNVDYLSDEVSKGFVWNQLLNRYKVFITGFLGVATITVVGCAMFLFTRLGTTSNNSKARMDTMIGIGMCLLSAAILGSVTVIFAYTYNVFR